MTKYLEIGQIVNTFGIKGMVKVKPFTDDNKRFDRLEKVYIKNKEKLKEYQIEEVKYHKDMILIKFRGIENPEQANLLRNSYLMIDREEEKPLEEGTYYIVDMIGMDVYTDEGEKLGNIEDIFNTGSNDIYVVKSELRKQILLPAISDVVKNIDMENKKMVVHLISGLI
ncbi:MAG TPA: 16S rRNA processing protein RimM [Clostridiales bacterium]|jgi:16S rRNA processing protein RimM|nr:16S rRNA processing protein RimM [Clostridiales bacterium]